MQRSITILFILFSLFIFASCTKDINNQNSLYNPGLMSANIGGSLWFANTGYAQTPNINTLDLYGTYNNQSYLSMVISNYSGIGTYSIGGFNAATFYDGSGNEYTATNGAVYVTSDNGAQVLGTFYFSGYSTTGGYPISVTSGQFNLSR
jgi:hypothetical protein